MAYAYTAIDGAGQSVHDVIQAASADEAARVLRAKGLLITELAEQRDGESRAAGSGAVRSGGSMRAGVFASLRPSSHRVSRREVVYATQQLSMLLGSGARMVPALQAVEAQSNSPAFKRLIHALRERVEDGIPLSAAMAEHPGVFNGVYRSIVAAGESSGRMPEAFERLSAYTRQQQELRNKVMGALAYPCLLIVMSSGVMGALFGFVLPRFRELFTTLGVELPASTRFFLRVSEWVGNHWILVLTFLCATIGGSVAMFLSTAGRAWWARAFTQVPVVGRLIRRLILGRLFRIWGLLIDNNVGLIEAIRLSKGTTRSTRFHELMDGVEQAVIDGRLVAAALRESPLVPTTMAAAVATGEESGRLGPALLFIADALDSENAQLVASLSRILEPAILIVMGAVVGVVAVSLFMPLFDIATITGGH